MNTTISTNNPNYSTTLEYRLQEVQVLPSGFRTEIAYNSSAVSVECLPCSIATSSSSTTIIVPSGGTTVSVGNAVGETTIAPAVPVNVTVIDGGSNTEPTLIELIAGSTIQAYRFVTTNSSGQAIYADSSIASHRNRIVGITLQASLPGDTLMIQEDMLVENTGWNFTPESLLYLGTQGTLTTNPRTGVFSNILGYAVTPTSVRIQIGRSISLSN